MKFLALIIFAQFCYKPENALQNKVGLIWRDVFGA